MIGMMKDSEWRLSPVTHELAGRALSGEWGRSLVDMKDLALDGRDDVVGMSINQRYAYCIKLIAESAPLRIVPGEKIVGSATLRGALDHAVPVFANGRYAFGSVSHLTAGFHHVLPIGYRGLREQIAERLERGGLDESGIDLLHAMQTCLDAASIWHRRHIDLLDRLIAESTGDARADYEQVRSSLANVPENPPTTFREAVQSLWLMFSFLRLCGNWPGIGRIDVMLAPYLKSDLEAGRITLDEAREVMAHFWIKGCDWIGHHGPFGGASGDAQYYQNIVLSGVDAAGNDVTNDVTYLVLDVVEELHISDFPIAVRVNANTPEELLRKIARVQRHGGGIVAVYNDDTVLPALVRFGYPIEIARGYANDGCWEVQIPGETGFGYYPFDSLYTLQETLGVYSTDTPPDYPDFESLYAAFRANFEKAANAVHDWADNYCLGGGPSVLIDLFVQDCIERGRGYYNRGSRYTVVAPHGAGIPNVGNSLLVIKKLVYEDRTLTLPELVEHLRTNWEGAEALRQRVLNQFEFYGNDSPEADAMVKRVFDDFLSFVEAVHERNGVLRPAGVSTFGRELGWRPLRKATADGHKAEDILAPNLSASPGTDKKGPTSVVKSHCAMDLFRLPNGTALDLKILPQSVKGEPGLKVLVGLLRSFVKLGGFFMHVDVVSNEVLRDAQAHPEIYPNLPVRVSGWSARFTTLDRDWQEMIINRTVHG